MVGPWAPDTRFEPDVFLDTLSAFVRQSRSLKWNQTDKTDKKHLDYLDETRAEWLRGKISEANDTLKTILGNANADSSSAITSEAHALIRYNTEYLADRLQEFK
jgi:hypothetical protein